MYVHPIEGPFRFAQDKDSELEVTFPGGTIRITAGGDIAELIISADEGMKIQHRRVNDTGSILYIQPGDVIEGQVNKPKLPQPSSEPTMQDIEDQIIAELFAEVAEEYKPDEYDDGRDFDEPYPPADDANYLHF